MTTFVDLLNHPVEEVHHNIKWMADSYCVHYHIFRWEDNYDDDCYNFYTDNFIDSEFVETQDRISFHVLKNFDFNGRYIWRLFIVKFDDVPIMVCKNAGREGDDHFANVILDVDSYKKMHKYVFGNMKCHIRNHSTVDLNDDASEFVDFYGNNLFSEFKKHV